MASRNLKPRQVLGKYRIGRRLGEGGFAVVYRAMDTVEGIPVALKVPHEHLVTKQALEKFRHEVRINATLDHPGILPIKNADIIDGVFVIAYPLGQETLGDRLTRRIALRRALDMGEQMLEALAYAHDRNVMHCDVKPENFIIFDDDRIRLADFGIAMISLYTRMSASGTGTVGYMAPEQAMGKPSFRSDCFSMGLILYRMLSGQLPEWPYEWPPPGYDVLRRKANRPLIAFLRRATQLSETKRFDDAGQMLAAYKRIKPKALATNTRKRRRSNSGKDWQEVRLKEFRRRYRKELGLRHDCGRCGGPISEPMQHCPWCQTKRSVHRDDTGFPRKCRRCKRGMKLDWRFCPWCFGAAQEPDTDREYSDVRYEGKCSNASCSRKLLMPFMRYCPWCRRKVQRRWTVSGSKRCGGCGWGVLPEYWSFCPWCSRKQGK